MSGRRSIYSNPVRQSYVGRRESGEVQHRNAVVRKRKDSVVHGEQQGNAPTTRRLNAVETKAFVLSVIGDPDDTTCV